MELVALEFARKLYRRWGRGDSWSFRRLSKLTRFQLTAILPLLPLSPTHPLVQLFQIKTLYDLHCPTENELVLCNRLLKPDFFPGSLWVMSLRACILYHLHGVCIAFKGTNP